MAKPPTETVRKLPPWLPVAGSAAIIFHLLAVLMLVLAAPSGPWPAFYGADMSPGPQFANIVNDALYPIYLRALGLTSNYHFQSNRPASYGVYFEVVLRDENGVVIKQLKIPQRGGNFWVRQRERLLAEGLASDIPTPPRGTEKVGAKGGASPRQDYLLNYEEVRKLVNPGKDEKGKALPPLISERYLQPFANADVAMGKVQMLVRVPMEETLAGNIPRTRDQIMRPAPWTMVLAKSYLRHLCHEYQAHTAELIRHSRPAVLPVYMFYQELPLQDTTFTEMIVHYGDLKQDFDEVHK